MQLKSFTAKNLAAAKELVKRELGEDAIITNTRDLGKDGYQIVCAIPHDGEEFSKQDDSDKKAKKNKNNLASNPQAKTSLNLLKQSLRILNWHQLPEHDINHFLDNFSRYPDKKLSDIEDAVSEVIIQELKLGSLNDLISPSKVIVLVGPPGAGKTSLVVKIALLGLLKNIKTAVICGDDAKVGGLEQLKIYTNRINCTFIPPATTRNLFLANLAKLISQNTFTIIDTTGVNPFIREEFIILSKLSELDQFEKFLVLPSYFDHRTAELITPPFLALKPTGLIGTFLDIEPRIGSLLSVSRNFSIPFYGWSRRSKVIDSFQEAKVSNLSEWIIKSPPHEFIEASSFVADNSENLTPQKNKLIDNNKSTQLSDKNEGYDQELDALSEDQRNKNITNQSSQQSIKQDSLQGYQTAQFDKQSTSQVAGLFDDVLEMRNLITVASGKGGVGKTWFSVSLAQCLARLGKRILVFDGDLGMANIDIQLGLTPQKDLSGVINNQYSLAQALIKYEKGGFDVVAGRSGSGSLSLLDPKQIFLLLSELRNVGVSYDHVILDLGSGMDKNIRLFSSNARLLFLVTNEEPTAIADTYAFMKSIYNVKSDISIQIIVNSAHSEDTGQKTYNTLANATKRFLNKTPNLAGVIIKDRSVLDAIRHQTPLLTRSPQSNAAKGILKIASKLTKGKFEKKMFVSE